MERTYEGFIKNLFNNKKTKQISKQDIDDCFQDIIDTGFNIIFLEKNETRNDNYLIIRKGDGDFTSGDFEIPKSDFSYEDAEESLLFAIPYIMDTYKIKFKYFKTYRHIMDSNTINISQFKFENFDDMCKYLKIHNNNISNIEIAF